MLHVEATLPDGLPEIGSDPLGTCAGAVTGLGYSPTMSVRPSQRWREGVEQDAHEIEAGILNREDVCMAELFPESFLTRTDEVLAAFAAEVAALNAPGMKPASASSSATTSTRRWPNPESTFPSWPSAMISAGTRSPTNGARGRPR